MNALVNSCRSVVKKVANNPQYYSTTTALRKSAVASMEELQYSQTPEQGVKVEACGTIDPKEEEPYEEEMFVSPHSILSGFGKEWGGPCRGGRLAEPTRFGDWERKGRCTDF